MTALQQKADELWDLPDSLTLPPYLKAYPQYAATTPPVLWTHDDNYDNLGKDEALDARYNKKLMLWHFSLDKIIAMEAAAYQSERLAKINGGQVFHAVNPAAAAQEALNNLALSGAGSFQRFNDEVKQYRQQLFERTNRFVFEGTALTLADYQGYPVFNSTGGTNANSARSSAIILIGWSCLFLFAGTWMFRRNTHW